jgi:hypothetical protein
MEFMALGAAATMCYRFDPSGNIAGGFDERLLRLPAKTWPLAVVPLWTRAIFMFILCIVQWLTVSLMNNTYFWWWWMLAPVELYLVLQTLIWIGGRIKGRSYAIMAAFFLFFLCLRLSSEPGGGIHLYNPYMELFQQFLNDLPQYLFSPPGCLFLLMACTILVIKAVTLRRRDESVGPPEIGELAARLMGREEVTGFATPNDALSWYIWRTAVWPMPLLTVGLSLGALLLGAIFMSQIANLQFALTVMPFAAFFAAIIFAEFAAAFGERQGGSFIFRAPLDCAGIAHARRCANLKGIAISFDIAIAWSIIGRFISEGVLLKIVMGIVAAKIYTPWEMAVACAGPLVLMGGIAYGLSGGIFNSGVIKRTALVVVFCYYFAPLIISLIITLLRTRGTATRVAEEQPFLFWYSAVTMHFVLLIMISIHALQKHLIKAPYLLFLGILWFASSLLFCMAGRDYGFSFLKWATMAVLCSFPFILPHIWAPLAVYMARHR